MHGKKICAIAAAVGFALAERLSAAPITITETVPGVTGSLDGTPFSNQTVVLTFQGDTSGLSHSGNVYSLPLASGTVTVPSAGTDTFTGSLSAFDNQATSIAGATQSPYDIFDINNSAFATYSFQTSVGPVSGTVTTGGGPDYPYPTTRGNFAIGSYQTTASFQAIVVPEPATCGILGIGASATMMLRRRRSASSIA